MVGWLVRPFYSVSHPHISFNLFKERKIDMSAVKGRGRLARFTSECYAFDFFSNSPITRFILSFKNEVPFFPLFQLLLKSDHYF